jgi:hypothetical protein
VNRRRAMEQKILPECVQRFDSIAEKLDGLIQRTDRINGRYEKHLEDSVRYRRDVDRHEHLLGMIEKEKLNTAKASQWRCSLIAATSVGILSLLANIVLKFF